MAVFVRRLVVGSTTICAKVARPQASATGFAFGRAASVHYFGHLLIFQRKKVELEGGGGFKCAKGADGIETYKSQDNE